MPAVVTSAAAAAAGRESAKARTFERVLADPFQRQQQRTLPVPLGVPRTSTRSQAEDSDARAIGAKGRETSCAADEAGNEEHGQVQNGQSNPVLNDRRSFPTASNGDGPNDEPEPDDESVDEPVLLIATPYPILVRQFSLVPIASFLATLTLTVLILGIWSTAISSTPIEFYIGLFIFSAVAWIVSFALRIPLYLIPSLICRVTPSLIPFFSTLVQVLCEEALRLSVIILSHLRLRDELNPSDPAFPCIVVLGIGWATAEVIVSVCQGYEQLALYKDILLPRHDPVVLPQTPSADTWLFDEETTRVEPPDSQNPEFFEDPEACMTKQIDHLIRVRARLELEEVYGIPFPNIPVFISSLQRIDSIILSLALFLNMSPPYLKNVSQQNMSHHPNHAQAIWDTVPTFLVLVTLRTFLSFMWSASVLPRIGIHTASYVGLLFALGALFAGLGRWDAL